MTAIAAQMTRRIANSQPVAPWLVPATIPVSGMPSAIEMTASRIVLSPAGLGQAGGGSIWAGGIGYGIWAGGIGYGSACGCVVRISSDDVDTKARYLT